MISWFRKSNASPAAAVPVTTAAAANPLTAGRAQKVTYPNDRYPSKEAHALSYVFEHATEGDPDSVLKAIDEFAKSSNWLMCVGDEKGPEVLSILREKKPKITIELGSYIGYSAVMFAKEIDETSHYYSFEVNPLFAAIADKIIEFAGLRSRVTVIVGSFSHRLERLKSKYGISQVDFAFFDHWKDLYLPDLKLLEASGLLVDGSVIVADNVICTGTPDYLAYIRANPNFTSRFIESYLEYTEHATKDGIEISVYHKKAPEAASESS